MADIVTLGGVILFVIFRRGDGRRLDAEMGCFGLFDEAVTDYDYLYEHTIAYCKQTGGACLRNVNFFKQFTNLTNTIQIQSQHGKTVLCNIKAFTHNL